MGEFELIRRCFDWNSGSVCLDPKLKSTPTPQNPTSSATSSVDSEHLLRPNHFACEAESHSTQLLLAIGDDSALIQSPSVQAICTDSLIEGTHFVLTTPSELIGYKSLAVNLSDLAAMGARPTVFLLAIGLPGNSANFDQDAWLSGFARGLKRCADEFGVRLIGGDTTRAPQITITITALGECASPLKRSSLKAGMRLAVSGSLGGAAHALKTQKLTQPNALNQPTPRVSLGLALGMQQQARAPIACIDISDGLLQDLSHLLKQSCDQLQLSNQILCAELKLEHLPADTSLSDLDETTRLALMLTGGEDYELLIGYDPTYVDLEKLSQQTAVALTDIGSIRLKTHLSGEAPSKQHDSQSGHFAEPASNQPSKDSQTHQSWQITATLSGSDYPLPAPADWGYDHFKSEQES